MSDMELGGRLLMALLFGGLIGIERQWHHKNAGLKTNTLVTVGATAFALISLRGFGPSNNPAAVAAGVVTGVGFIGGGVIMRRGGSVQGINTAATLWAAGSLGLSIGMGYYKLAGLLLVTVLIIQFSFRWAASLIDKRSGLIVPYITYHLLVTSEPPAIGEVRSTWSAFARLPGVAINEYSEGQADSLNTLKVSFRLSEARAADMVELVQKLAGTPGVTAARWSQAESAEVEQDA